MDETTPMVVADSPAAPRRRVVREDMKPLPKAMMNSPSRGASAMASKRGDIQTSSWMSGMSAFSDAHTGSTR